MRYDLSGFEKKFQSMPRVDQDAIAGFMGLQQIAEEKPIYFTKQQIESGEGYVCMVPRKKGEKPCTKRTRSLERSKRHATNNAELQEFGHIAVR